jgi:hypothetical protein
MRAIAKLCGIAVLGVALAALAGPGDSAPDAASSEAQASPDASSSEAQAAREAPSSGSEASEGGSSGNAQQDESVNAAPQPMPQVVYVPPSRGSARARTGGGTRGPGKAPTLAVLAPDHVGVTNVAQPTFAWFASEPIPGRVDFTLVDPEAVEPLVEVTLPSPNEPGVQLIHLADYDAQLAEGRSYDWSVALVVDPESRDLDVVAAGAIRRAPASPRVAAEIAAGTPAYIALARAGVWYDAMADLSAAIAANPEDAALRAQRAALLEQVGVGAAAVYERENGAGQERADGVSSGTR